MRNNVRGINPPPARHQKNPRGHAGLRCALYLVLSMGAHGSIKQDGNHPGQEKNDCPQISERKLPHPQQHEAHAETDYDCEDIDPAEAVQHMR